MEIGSNGRCLFIIYTSVLNSCSESFISEIAAIAKVERTSNIEQHSLRKIILSTGLIDTASETEIKKRQITETVIDHFSLEAGK